jgi:hypothetical protein
VIRGSPPTCSALFGFVRDKKTFRKKAIALFAIRPSLFLFPFVKTRGSATAPKKRHANAVDFHALPRSIPLKKGDRVGDGRLFHLFQINFKTCLERRLRPILQIVLILSVRRSRVADSVFSPDFPHIPLKSIFLWRTENRLRVDFPNREI